MDQRLAEPGLFMTEATRGTYVPEALEAIERGLPPGDHIIITGPADFAGGEASQDLKSLFNAAGYSERFVSEILLQGIDEPSHPKNMSSPARVHPDKWKPLEEEIGAENVQALRDELLNDYKDNACVITLPATDSLDSDGYAMSTPHGISAAYLDALPDRLKNENLPGTPQDIQIYTAHHEGDHCQNSSDRYPEYQSDTYANREYAQNLAEGITTNPEVPYMMRDMRAGAAIIGVGGDEYLTTGLSALAGETPLTEQQLDVAQEQILEAQSRIYGIIEEDTGIRHDTLLDPNNMRMNARMAYGQAKTMMEHGAFDDIPYGKTTVERFIDGAERYGHEYYNVRSEDMRTEPPVMPPEAYGVTPGLPTFARDMAIPGMGN